MSVKKLLGLLFATGTSAAVFLTPIPIEYGVVPSERGKECAMINSDQGVKLIDWGILTTKNLLKECIFHAASTHSDPERTVAWLKENNIQSIGPFPIPEPVMKMEHGISGEGSMVSATLTHDQIPFRLNLIDRMTVHSASISIVFAPDNRPIKIGLSLTRK